MAPTPRISGQSSQMQNTADSSRVNERSTIVEPVREPHMRERERWTTETGLECRMGDSIWSGAGATLLQNHCETGQA